MGPYVLPHKRMDCRRVTLVFFLLTAFAGTRGLARDTPVTYKTSVNKRPVIGILTQAGDPEDTWVGKSQSYIAASYVKFAESGGARVVPILETMPGDQLLRLLTNINGVIIPGGGAVLRPGHPFYDTTKRVLEYAISANDKGDYFPVLGICLGFETVAIIVSGDDHSILSEFDAEDTAAPLYYTQYLQYSRFYNSWSQYMLRDVMLEPLARESHSHGIRLKVFNEHKKLRDFFYPTTLSVDKEGQVYISTLEAQKYPVYLVQWHPEKNTYEWGPHLGIPHSYIAVEVTHQVSRFFVNETRHSHHRMASLVEEDRWLIYNDERVFSGRHIHETDRTWCQEAYIFPTWDEYYKQLQQRGALSRQ